MEQENTNTATEQSHGAEAASVEPQPSEQNTSEDNILEGSEEQSTDEEMVNTEASTESETTAEAPEAEPEENKVPERVVPEAADYKVPEGLPEDIRTWAKEADMTQEQLDSALVKFGGYMKSVEEGNINRIRKGATELIKGWGDNAKQNTTLAKRAIEHMDPDGDLKDLLKLPEVGNHPAVIKFFYKNGLKLREGGFIKSGRPSSGKTEQNRAHRMYPNDAPKS